MHSYLAHLTIAFIFVATSVTGFAQIKINAVSFSAEYSPASHYKRPLDKETSVKTDATTSVQRYNAGIGLSLKSKVDTLTGKTRIWTSSFNGSFSQLTNRDYKTPVLPSRLLSCDIGIQHFRSMRNRWGQAAFASVGLATDLERIDGNDIFVTAGTLFIKSYTPRFSIGFGAMVMTSKRTFIAFPALTVQWEAGKKYKLTISAPDKEPGVMYRIGVERALNKHTDIAFTFRMRMMSYDVETATEQRSMNALEIPIGIDYTLRRANRYIVLSGGFVPAREYEFRKRGFSHMFKEELPHKLALTYFVKVAAGWRR